MADRVALIDGSIFVGDENDSINSAAILQADSTTKGALPWPRMTEAQRDAISSPPEGLTIWNTDTNAANVYDGSSWAEIGSGSGSNTLTVTNSSGATANANDVGYLDDAGEYQTTTTEGDSVTWCVVVEGGANTADITVQTRGNATVAYTGSAPSAGDYLITSTTAGSALASSTMRPEIFAICTAGGSAGDVEVLLLTGTTFVPKTIDNDIAFFDNHDDSSFESTISGSPSSTSVVYGSVTTGDESLLGDIPAGSIGKVRLYNTTRSSYRLIDTVDTSTNTITTLASTDAWANGDDITVESQTVDFGSAVVHFMEIDLTQQTTIPVLARAMAVVPAYRDTGAAGQSQYIHPFEAYSVPKQYVTRPQVAGQADLGQIVVMPLIEQVFVLAAQASGAGAVTLNKINLAGYYLATP